MMAVRNLILLALLLPPAAALADDPKGVLAGTVVDAADQPISGATVILARPGHGGANVASDRTGLDGRFRFERLPAGSYDVLAVFGGARVLEEGIDVAPEATVAIRPRLAGDPEVITIHEQAPVKIAPKAMQRSVKRLLPWTDEAIDKNAWAVGWMLLEIDARGQVSGFRFLNRPPMGLDEVATREAWKLRFEPARDVTGRPVASQMLWKMEWPSYWWWNAQYMRPTPGFLAVDPSIKGQDDASPRGAAGPFPFLLPASAPTRTGPPCRGSGPMNLDSSHLVYRDCTPPDLSKAISEPLIVRRD